MSFEATSRKDSDRLIIALLDWLLQILTLLAGFFLIGWVVHGVRLWLR